jgi:hypothetical protein
MKILGKFKGTEQEQDPIEVSMMTVMIFWAPK